MARPSERRIRREAGRMLAALVRIFGLHNLALADDLVQDTLCRAVEVRKYHGIPDDPQACFSPRHATAPSTSCGARLASAAWRPICHTFCAASGRAFRHSPRALRRMRLPGGCAGRGTPYRDEPGGDQLVAQFPKAEAGPRRRGSVQRPRAHRKTVAPWAAEKRKVALPLCGSVFFTERFGPPAAAVRGLRAACARQTRRSGARAGAPAASIDARHRCRRRGRCTR